MKVQQLSSSTVRTALQAKRRSRVAAALGRMAQRIRDDPKELERILGESAVEHLLQTPTHR